MFEVIIKSIFVNIGLMTLAENILVDDQQLETSKCIRVLIMIIITYTLLCILDSMMYFDHKQAGSHV